MDKSLALVVRTETCKLALLRKEREKTYFSRVRLGKDSVKKGHDIF